VNLAYANVDKDTWVSVTGTARVSEDMQKKKELFNVMAKAWFPGGVDDPDMELVEVKIDEAEYWNVKENKLLQLLKMGKAAATGTRPKGMGEHAEVHFD
jgi:general stress protein 26